MEWIGNLANMNKTIAEFTRNKIIEGLRQCTRSNRRQFRLMYNPEGNDYDYENTVKSMNENKLNWALSQVENTLKKSRKH